MKLTVYSDSRCSFGEDRKEKKRDNNDLEIIITQTHMEYKITELTTTGEVQALLKI